MKIKAKDKPVAAQKKQNKNLNDKIIIKSKDHSKKRKFKKSISYIDTVDKKDKNQDYTSNPFNKGGSKHRKKEKRLWNSMENTSYDEEYKPGMLTNYFHQKNNLIASWDPSFGLNKNEEEQGTNEGQSKFKINPLFDLSKRQNIVPKPLIDEIRHTVFIGNLPHSTKDDHIRSLFKSCGSIRKIKIKRIKNKSPSMITRDHKKATIVFDEQHSCENALKLNGVLYKGCHLQVYKEATIAKSDNNLSVFVGNLEFNATEEDLWKAFENCGEIGNVTIRPGKGCAFVNFKDQEAVNKALEFDGLSILNRNIRVVRHDTSNKSSQPIIDNKNSAINSLSNYANSTTCNNRKQKRVKTNKNKKIKVHSNELKEEVVETNKSEKVKRNKNKSMEAKVEINEIKENLNTNTLKIEHKPNKSKKRPKMNRCGISMADIATSEIPKDKTIDSKKIRTEFGKSKKTKVEEAIGFVQTQRHEKPKAEKSQPTNFIKRNKFKKIRVKTYSPS